LPDGSYGGEPAGFLVSLDERKLYFACDTALFSDMKLIGDAEIDLAVLPIGDLFTMGIDDSIAATRLVRPGSVAPSHFNTWPPIAQDVNAWAKRIKSETGATPIVTSPGERFSV
jgi:L-ascorbate metabolism protein UlaG (beta-lactamase superfamily)